MNRVAFCQSFIVAFAGIGLPTARAASWVGTGGPVGGLGYDVRIDQADKNTMFVTDNYAGVAKSVDRGQSWRAANTGITVRGGPSGDAYTIFSLTVDPNDPNVVWAGTNGDPGSFGAFKSTDGGAHWTLKTGGIASGPFGIVFRGFTVQPGNSNIVYAQAELPTAAHGKEFDRTQGCVYKSTNGGDSWSLVWSGDNLARHLIIDPTQTSTLYLSTGIFDREANNSDCVNGVAGGVGVLKSTDGGATWVPMNAGLTDLYVGALRMDPSHPQVLLAATGNNACTPWFAGAPTSGLFRTSDGGASWQRVISGDIFTTAGFSPSSPLVVYAGSAQAFFRSQDGGLTWQRYGKPSGAEWGPAGIRAGVPIDVVVDPDSANVLYANNYGGGVFASTDGAQSWKVWSRGYTGAEIHNIAIPDTRTASLYAIGRSGPFVTPNYGLDWVGIGNGEADFPEWNSVAIKPGSPDVVVIADEHQGVLLRSADGGASFAIVYRDPFADATMSTSREGFKGLAFAPSQPSVVYAGVAKDRTTIDTSVPIGPVFYRSTDSGQTFAVASADLDGSNVHRFAVDRTHANLIYAATSRGLYKSIDSGTTWTVLGLAGQNVVAVAVSPSDPNAIVASVKNVGIFASADGGASWPGGPFNTGFTNPNPAVLALVFDATASVLYAGDLYSGVYRSADVGRSWAGFPDAPMTGLQMRAVKDLALGGGVLYAATQGGGVFRYGGPSLVPSPVAIDFGPVAVGASSAARTVTLYDTGADSRMLTGKMIAGPQGADFAVRNDVCAASLAPSTSCTFAIVFTPSAAGARSAVLNIGSDDPFGATYPIALSGSGLPPLADAGTSVDATAPIDAGASTDAGTSIDATAPSDAPGGVPDAPAIDAGSAVPVDDAGASSDGVADVTGPVESGSDGATAGEPIAANGPTSSAGCHCSMGSTRRSRSAWVWLFAVSAVTAIRRSRRHVRQSRRGCS